jgi:glycolate oxidase FAD binding subunit
MLRTRWNRRELLSGSDLSLRASMKASLSIAEKFASAVGPANVRVATVEDAVAGAQPEFVVSPGSQPELAAVLACANEAGLGVIPRGGGTKLDWGNPPTRAEIIVSTLRLNRVLEHAWADLTVVVEAGCTIQALQDVLAQHGQRLAIDVLWPERATVGGVLSTNDSAALRWRYGALRDLIIGVTLALSDGTLASSGGRVVKNVAGYDLPKLATGALGTLGVITHAIFRLHPLCRESLTLSFAAPTLEKMQGAILTVQDSTLAHSALQIRCANGQQPEADILFEATPAGLTAQKQKLEAILDGCTVQISAGRPWSAKQELLDAAKNSTTIAKLSVLPTRIAEAVRELEKVLADSDFEWQLVMQATGIGWLSISNAAANMNGILQELRSGVENEGGSLVLLRKPPGADSPDTWGNPGDAIGVMRALKRQLDPKATLNPGRFVGGI